MHNFVRFLLGGLLLAIGTACGSPPRPAEQAVVGRWVSHASAVTFEFFDNGTFVIDDPSHGQLTGSYYSIGSGEDLRDAQFRLRGGYDIRFTPNGHAFYIYIDGAGAPDVLYHRDVQPMPKP